MSVEVMQEIRSTGKLGNRAEACERLERTG